MNYTKFAAALFLLLPLAAAGQGKDELWEITSKMDMPGLPAGMGASTQRVCQDKDPRKQPAQGPDMEKCKVTDSKQSGNKTTVTMSCPDGTAVFESTYNAARTEYKGTMRMKTRDGDMTMAMSGRKVGACDATAEREKQQQQMAAIQGQAAQAQAEVKKANEAQIRQCAEAAQNMDYGKLGMYGQCREHGELCKAMMGSPETRPVASACIARQAEYCRRYRTEDGFLKAKADPKAAEACGLSVDQVKADLCPGAAQKESLAFLGRYCLAEAKPFAERHCAGRDFTALRAKGGKGDKYDDFCMAYLSNASLAKGDRTNPAEAVGETINQGINKLRGLFGR